MIALTEAQVEDLRELQRLCDERKAQIVIIGAIAYQLNFPCEERHTADIDLAVALDLDDFAELEGLLQKLGWKQTPKQEHRWRGPRGTLVDIVPAGRNLRDAKKVTWPKSQFTMSLVGFDHVFSDSKPAEIDGGLILQAIPAPVLMLLKIVAVVDDPQRRAKDLIDIRAMLKLYEADSDRVYSEIAFEAALPDVDLANALLLGLDLRSLCTLEELVTVHQFLSLVTDETKPTWQSFVSAANHYGRKNTEAARAEIEAFRRGLDKGTAGTPNKQPTSQRSILDRTTMLAKQIATVRVSPLVPPPPRDEFQVVKVDAEEGMLYLRKRDTDANVSIPISQIEALFPVGSGQLMRMHLKGRLQWITLSNQWEIYPEKPESYWGIAKPSGPRDPRVQEVERELRPRGYTVTWTHESTVNSQFGADREIIYDRDGRYFRNRSQPFDQILVRSKQDP